VKLTGDNTRGSSSKRPRRRTGGPLRGEGKGAQKNREGKYQEEAKVNPGKKKKTTYNGSVRGGKSSLDGLKRWGDRKASM